MFYLLSSISYWAAKVITNLLSSIPIVGNNIVYLIWSGFNINMNTITIIYTLHLVLPLIMFPLIMLHLYCLHQYHSSNKNQASINKLLVNFNYYYVSKDYMNILLFMFAVMIFMLLPLLLSDNEMFIINYPSIYPLHIVPEWYYLFAYAILRSIPNKLFMCDCFHYKCITLIFNYC